MYVFSHTTAGVAAFRDWLASGASGGVPSVLIEEGANCEFVPGSLDIDEGMVFGSRYEMAVYIKSVLDRKGLKHFPPSSGVWSWLSAIYLDVLAPLDSAGDRPRLSREMDSPAYIFHANSRKFYRHRVGAAVMMLAQLGEYEAKPLLCSAPWVLSDYCEQNYARISAGRYDKLSITIANKLYWDRVLMKPKKKYDDGKPGSLAHLHRWIGQLSLNYDISRLSLLEVEALLPAEFRQRL
jgi:hypothetical protein